MGVNNFKKLEDIEFENLSARMDLVKNNIGANLGSLRFITDIIELYFPKVIDLFVGLTGGNPGHIENTKTKNKYPDLRSE